VITHPSRQIKVGAILSYFVIFFYSAAGLIYTPWMVHKLGKADYGLYALVISFLAYFVTDYGISQAINKMISQYKAEGKDEKIKNLLGITTKIYLAIDAFICLVLIVVYLHIENIFIKLTVEELIKFKNAFLLAALFSVLSFPFLVVRGIFMSYEFFIQTKLFELAKRVSTIVFTVVLLLLNYGLYALVIAYGFIPFLISVAETFYLHRKGIRINLNIWDKSIVRSVLGISIWLFLLVLAELLVNNISPSVLGVFSGTSEIAIFAIGNVIFGYVYTLAAALNSLFLPKITRLHVTNQSDQIDHLSVRVGRIQFMVLGYMIVGIVVLGKEFIELWMGPDFRESYYVALFMILPNLIIHSQQIESTYLFVLDKLKYQAYMLLFCAASSVTLSVVLCPKWGAVGSAIAIGFSNTVFMLIGMNVIYVKKLNFNIKLYVKECVVKFIPLYISLCTVYFIVDFYLLNAFLSMMSWKSLIIKGAMYSVLFFSSVYFLAMNKNEKTQLHKIIARIKQVIHT
jgi:O-antigen/teichoic acid export membrane protein